MWIPLVAALVLGVQVAPAPVQVAPAPGPLAQAHARARVVKVVDGDTLDVLLDGTTVSLRLSSVDTEEKISGRAGGSPTKPQTVFGEETALWARALFATFPAPVVVGLAFDGGPEDRRLDAYGRLLCHVILPDGRDFNLLLVELGKSPYFDKYGYSLRAHADFVRAEDEARAARRGIWDPASNRARTPGAPSAIRPYERLLPWWEARAEAIEAFRRDAARPGSRLVSHEDPAGLARAFAECRRDPAARVTVFGAIGRFYEEDDGSLTALLRGGDRETALRAVIPAAERAELESRLRASTAEFRQNYLRVTGRMERNARGFVLTGAGALDWVSAEPAYPPR
jgi:micrococcal nuclease